MDMFTSKRGGPKGLYIIVYLIFALYFLNYPFQIIAIPESFATPANPWIIFFGGLLILLGAINYFKVKRRYL